MKQVAIYLMGPTACGKTAAACDLAREIYGEIVSVDSALVYRGLDIGTAKPSPAVLKKNQHHLIDICDPSERYSAARFRDDAVAAIRDIHARGRVPILTGGTGLYFRILEQGIAEIPAIDPAVRAQLADELRAHGVVELHARLAVADPISAGRINPNDSQRTLRALEVFVSSGVRMSDLLAHEVRAALPFYIEKLVLAPAERSWLHRRIARRFDAMLAAGFINEVSALRARGDLSLRNSALRAVGYRAVWGYLDGEYDYCTMIERGISATRQLAKRQFTWFRAISDARWFDPSGPDTVRHMAVAVKRRIKVN
jgi:tRNA dimethylallyltransferase